jgi:signal transduction histidine kinase
MSRTLKEGIMKAGIKRRRVLMSGLAGAAIGYLILHPYSMLVYLLHREHEAMERGIDLSTAIHDAAFAFSRGMLHMGIPYALLGAVAGVFFGFWMEAERRRDEMEKRAAAVDTLRQLMVTLSHYLLNATTVIGGYTSLVLRKEDNPELANHLEVIKKESENIEAVVRSLQSLETVETESYGGGSEVLMIDIKRQIEERLKENSPNLNKRDAA